MNDDLIKLTNCRLAAGGDSLTAGGELWISPRTGRIVDAQHMFYEQRVRPAAVHDLGGRILAPGLIDVQLNGGFGVDFSEPAPDFAARLATVNRLLVRTGVTSYLPTLTSQLPHVYEANLPHLAPPPGRNPADGAEPLGAHCEGPFLNPLKNGIHPRAVLRSPDRGIADLDACYGPANLHAPTVRMVTLAPEVGDTAPIIAELAARGIIVAAGHSNASYDQMWDAVAAGVRMVTHLFNAIAQPHHRTPGIFGILGAPPDLARPFFGIIADDIHVHPSLVRVAHYAHPAGTILVSDAMSMLGLPDGLYPWAHGRRVIAKRGPKLTLHDSDTIAGSCVTLVECLSNFVNWTGAPLGTAIRTATETPARMLGLDAVKGSLRPGADADLVVLDDRRLPDGRLDLAVHRVYKFGVQVFAADAQAHRL